MYTPEKIFEHLQGLLLQVELQEIRDRFAGELRYARRTKRKEKYGDDLYKYVYAMTIKHILDL